jgi:hypothetical protein
MSRDYGYLISSAGKIFMYLSIQICSEYENQTFFNPLDTYRLLHQLVVLYFDLKNLALRNGFFRTK